jgi:hypothetical protein
MKKPIIILLFFVCTVYAAAQETDGYGNGETFEVEEIALNDAYFVKLRQISEDEYTVRMKESAHLRHKPYKVITDFKEAQKMLGRKMKIIERQEGEFKFIETEITFKDGTKRKWDWTFADGFRAYFPELNVLLWEGEATGDYQIDLNDSREEAIKGNPYNHAVSPDRKLRINGYYIGGASEGWEYFLEKWNTKKKRYEFFTTFEGLLFYYSRDWFWTSNSTALFRYGWWEECQYYEIEIIEK